MHISIINTNISIINTNISIINTNISIINSTNKQKSSPHTDEMYHLRKEKYFHFF